MHVSGGRDEESLSSPCTHARRVELMVAVIRRSCGTCCKVLGFDADRSRGVWSSAATLERPSVCRECDLQHDPDQLPIKLLEMLASVCPSGSCAAQS